nr:hypothetical protein KitaXyl93_45250 [Kitasatospora sp. Xyl93]
MEGTSGGSAWSALVIWLVGGTDGVGGVMTVDTVGVFLVFSQWFRPRGLVVLGRRPRRAWVVLRTGQNRRAADPGVTGSAALEVPT